MSINNPQEYSAIDDLDIRDIQYTNLNTEVKNESTHS